jgi:hypothetical protein
MHGAPPGGGDDAPTASPGVSTAPALLRLTCKLAFGDSLLVCGSHPAVGAWDAAGAAAMTWTEGDVWQAQAALPQEGRLEAKFLVRAADGALTWQAGANLVLEISKGAPQRGEATIPPQRRFAFAGSFGGGAGADKRPVLSVQGPVPESEGEQEAPAAAKEAPPPAPKQAEAPAAKVEVAPAPPPAPEPEAAKPAEAPAPAPPAPAPPAPEPAAPEPVVAAVVEAVAEAPPAPAAEPEAAPAAADAPPVADAPAEAAVESSS